MKTSIHCALTLVGGLAAAALSCTAHATIVLDDFNSGSQLALTSATSLTGATASSQASFSTVAPLAALGTRRAATTWATLANQNGLLTESQRLARTSGLTIDPTAGIASLSFAGRVSSANVGLGYFASAGQWIDFSAIGTGLRLDGSLTSLTGATSAFFQNISLTARVTDRFGVVANHVWYANTLSGGFGGLAAPVEADFASFLPAAGQQSIDFTGIVSLEINLSYNYTGLALAPNVAGQYQLGSVSLVPAPGALALFCVAGLPGRRRRLRA